MNILFNVPIIPRGQRRARAVSRGGFATTHKDPKQRAEEEKLSALILKYAPQIPMAGPLECRIAAFMPIPASKSGKWKRKALAGEELPTGKPDLDNMAKHVLDVMSGVFFPDDRSIVDLILSKRYGEPARYEIEVRCVAPESIFSTKT